MKTIIAFIDPVAKLLVSAGYDLDKVINACQSDANSAQGREGASKRSDFKGGHSYKADGTLQVKDLAFTEQTKVDYTLKATAPGETVKWHDSLATHFKKTGQPSGALTVDIIPTYVRAWLDSKMRVTAAPANKPANGRGTKPANGTPEPAKV